MNEEEKINDLRRSILIDKYKIFLTKELEYNADIAKHIITITTAIVGAISVALFKVNITGVPVIFYILYTFFIFLTYVLCLLLLHATRKIIGLDSSILYYDFGLVGSSDNSHKLHSQHKSWINVEIHTSHCMFISFAIFLFLTFGFIFLLLNNNKINNCNSNSDMNEHKIISRNIEEKEYKLPNDSDVNRALFKAPVQTHIPVQSPSTSSNQNTPITNANTTPQDVKKP